MAEAPVVELRQYTLKPGMRGTLVDVFEAHLIEGQEAAGMTIGGLFLDRDDPDRFVWMRGFAGMRERQQALEAFYGGPVWAAHSGTANPTMVDVDNVLLLRPTVPSHPPEPPAHGRQPAGSRRFSQEWVSVTVYIVQPDPEVMRWLSTDVHHALVEAVQLPVATWRTEPAENTFPALPVRPDHAFVWAASFADEATYLEAHRRLDASTQWQQQIRSRLDGLVLAREHLRLAPTARSQHPSRAT